MYVIDNRVGAVEGSSTSDTLTRRQLVRALIAATVGSTIEWYDFQLFGFAASLYLNRLFFPSHDPFVSLMAALATFAVGFAARPVGAAIFGHYGDRIGRKATLITTLSLMGMATFAMGLIPSYAQVGLAGTVALVILRILQGIGVGGEWGGAILLPIEWGNRTGRRGLWGSFPQMGLPLGILLGYTALQASTSALGKDSYWGWRVPFLASAVLLAVGLYVRLGILETPVFARLLEEHKIEPRPVLQVLRRQWREVVLTCLICTAERGPSYLYTTYVLAYGVGVLALPQSRLITVVQIGAAVSMFTSLIFGRLSDSFGRKRMYLVGAAATFVWALPYYGLLNSGVTALLVVATAGAFAARDMMYGPQAAFIAEAFSGRLRYSGASLGYHLAAITAGGWAPIIAAALFRAYHSTVPISLYVMACAVVSFVSAALLRERSGSDLATEYDEPARVAPALS
ncbi:MAG TPA: MFS transporter [Candidatus Dormibacteraeota bacterium]|nr:MFS transporter [Candidatus Dormibacteraeota bacterium]